MLIVARVTAAGGFRTVRIGKRGGARNDSLSVWAAPRDCNFTALRRSRCRNGGAKNNCNGKRKSCPNLHFCLLVHERRRNLQLGATASSDDIRPSRSHSLGLSLRRGAGWRAAFAKASVS